MHKTQIRIPVEHKYPRGAKLWRPSVSDKIYTVEDISFSYSSLDGIAALYILRGPDDTEEPLSASHVDKLWELAPAFHAQPLPELMGYKKVRSSVSSDYQVWSKDGKKQSKVWFPTFDEMIKWILDQINPDYPDAKVILTAETEPEVKFSIDFLPYSIMPEDQKPNFSGKNILIAVDKAIRRVYQDYIYVPEN